MNNIIDSDIVELLNSEAERINTTAFIANDPVQFPRQFDKIQDIEIASFLSAIIAWGRRTMICRNGERLMQLMNNEPYNFTISGAFEDIDDDRNIHRTFFGRHLKYFLRGMRSIYAQHNSLDEFAHSRQIGNTEAPAWALVESMQQIMSLSNSGTSCPQCLPTNLRQTALKRINMALRWLVRNDGIVDMGIWQSIKPSQLYIPLDIHVGNTARDLNLINRKQNDRKTVEQLTATLRSLRADDPAIYDFALFGIGMGL